MGLGFIGWLCYVAAAVVLWLVAFSVIPGDVQNLAIGLALIATGLSLRAVTLPGVAVTRPPAQPVA